MLRRQLLTLAVVVLGLASAASSAFAGSYAHSPYDKRPSLRYSDVWRGPQNGTLEGYFDIIYFNSVVAFGSRVFLHYGYEESTYNYQTRRFEVSSVWLDENVVELKQWEEFGWFTRLSRIIQKRGAARKISGLDFYLRIVTADGDTIYNRGHESSEVAFYRGISPDMRICRDLGHEALKICAVPLEVSFRH